MNATLLAAVLAGCSCAALPSPRHRVRRPRPPPTAVAVETATVRRYRGVFAALAAVAGLTFAPSPVGWATAAVLFGGVWFVSGRAEPAAVRRRRQQTRRDLPHVVRLLSLALSAGMTVPAALQTVEEALPESTGELRAVRGRLDLGLDPQTVWSEVAAQPELAPLGRALVRAHVVGASPGAVLTRLADELAESDRADVEDRARAVGIKAALPLGLCLLPAFLLVGIVPLVASALTVLRW